MKDAWYSDKRDLVKWGTLLRLAEIRESPAILQVAYYRPNSWPTIEIDGRNYELPENVTAHFRRISNVRTLCATLQTWFPLPIQVYVNGHEWLARKLEQNGIRYTKLENTFLWIEDFQKAQKFSDCFC